MKTQPIDPCHHEMLGRGTTSSSSRIAVSMLPAAHRVGQAHAKPGYRRGVDKRKVWLQSQACYGDHGDKIINQLACLWLPLPANYLRQWPDRDQVPSPPLLLLPGCHGCQSDDDDQFKPLLAGSGPNVLRVHSNTAPSPPCSWQAESRAERADDLPLIIDVGND